MGFNFVFQFNHKDVCMQSYYQNKTMLVFLHSPLECTEEGKHTHTVFVLQRVV